VRVYKLFIAETIEEVMQERLSSKRQISQTAIIGVDGQEFSFSEILNALKLHQKNKSEK
jgi:SNF2 family DNA or RNA helicase